MTFADGGNSIGTGMLSGTTPDTATLLAPASVIDEVGTLANPVHVITAVYGNDVNFTSSTGTLTSGQTVTAAGTTITLASTANDSSVQGNPITLTATVTGLSGLFDDGGTVTFTEDGTTPSNGTVTLSGGQATFTTVALATGLHAFTATYNGDTNYTLSTQAALTQTVRGDSTTTVSALPNPINFSMTDFVTMTATVTVAGGGSGITPTGTVTFEDGSISLGTAGLTGTSQATATYTTQTPLAGGTYSLSAVYGGDSNLFSSTATAVPETVTPVASTLNLTYGGGSYGVSILTTYGTNVSYTVSVGGNGAGTPTGTVTFSDGLISVGTGALTSGPANTGLLTYTTSSQPVCSDQFVTAAYGGDSNFTGSTPPSSSTDIEIWVAQGNTTTVLSSSGNPSMIGQSVTLTASVTVGGGGNAPATGTVTFLDNNVSIGTASVLSTSNTATYTTNSLLGGSANTITAVYSGDTNATGSTSSTFTQNVQAGTTTALSATQGSNNLLALTASVSATSGSFDNSGIVEFGWTGPPVGWPVSLTGGPATLIGLLTAGTHTIMAVYSGDVNFTGSTSYAADPGCLAPGRIRDRHHHGLHGDVQLAVEPGHVKCADADSLRRLGRRRHRHRSQRGGERLAGGECERDADHLHPDRPGQHQQLWRPDQRHLHGDARQQQQQWVPGQQRQLAGQPGGRELCDDVHGHQPGQRGGGEFAGLCPRSQARQSIYPVPAVGCPCSSLPARP